MNRNDYAINMEHLSDSFGEAQAHNALDLRVPQKSFYAFLGPNVAEKTTKIKLLLAWLKSSSVSDKIFGKDIICDSVDTRTNIGYLPRDAGVHVIVDKCPPAIEMQELTQDGDVYPNAASGVSEVMLQIDLQAGIGTINLLEVQ